MREIRITDDEAPSSNAKRSSSNSDMKVINTFSTSSLSFSNTSSAYPIEPVPFFRRIQQIEQDEQDLHHTTSSDFISSSGGSSSLKFPPRPPPFESQQKTQSQSRKLKYADLFSKQSDYASSFSHPSASDDDSKLAKEEFIVRDEFMMADETKQHLANSEDESLAILKEKWIRVLMIQSRQKQTAKEALIDLEETLGRWFDSRGGIKSGMLDLIVLPEDWWPEPVHNWDTMDPIDSVWWIKKLKVVVAKFGAYCVIGSFEEIQRDVDNENEVKTFSTSMLLNRKGNFVGMYRKRNPIASMESAGDRCAIFDTDFGRVALMLCFDVEDSQTLRENLAYKPDLIVNPAFIQSTTPIGEDHSTTWKTAMVVFSSRLEKICLDHCTSILRVDQPFSSKYGKCASGTSQLIGPYRSLLSPTSSETCFFVQVPRNQKEDYARFRSCTRLPFKERTETRMNTLNRYRVATYKRHGTHGGGNGAAVTSIRKCGSKLVTASSDCSVIIHDYRSHKVLHHIRDAHKGPIFSMDIVGNTIWTCSIDRCISEWTLDGKCVRIEQLPPNSFITAIHAHPTDVNLMWLGDSSGRVRFYDKRSGSVESCQLITSSRDGSSPVISLRAHKSNIYCVHQDSHSVKIWGTSSGLSRPPVTFVATNTVTAISNIINDRMVIATRDRLESWNVVKGDQLLKYNIPYGSKAEAVELLSDSHAIVSLVPTEPIRLEDEVIMTDRLFRHAALNLFDFANYRSNSVFLHEFSEDAQLFTVQSISTEDHSSIFVGDLYGRVAAMEFESNQLKGNFFQTFC